MDLHSYIFLAVLAVRSALVPAALNAPITLGFSGAGAFRCSRTVGAAVVVRIGICTVGGSTGSGSAVQDSVRLQGKVFKQGTGVVHSVVDDTISEASAT